MNGQNLFRILETKKTQYIESDIIKQNQTLSFSMEHYHEK